MSDIIWFHRWTPFDNGFGHRNSLFCREKVKKIKVNGLSPPRWTSIGLLSLVVTTPFQTLGEENKWLWLPFASVFTVTESHPVFCLSVTLGHLHYLSESRHSTAVFWLFYCWSVALLRSALLLRNATMTLLPIFNRSEPDIRRGWIVAIIIIIVKCFVWSFCVDFSTK